MNTFTDKASIETVIQEHPFFLIYKHSPTCSVSLIALEQVQAFAATHDIPAIRHIDVLQERDISDQIEEITDITHESPQILLIREKKVVAHTSHFSITKNRIMHNVEKYGKKYI